MAIPYEDYVDLAYLGYSLPVVDDDKGTGIFTIYAKRDDGAASIVAQGTSPATAISALLWQARAIPMD